MKTYTIIGGVNGTLIPKGERRPAWVQELSAYLKEI